MSAVPHYDESIRREQIQAGRAMRDEERSERRTLSPRTGYQRPNTARAKDKSPLKGHEAFLKALELSGARVKLEKCDGTIIEGTVRHSDKFTISMNDGARDRVIFKHDISEFSALTPRVVPDSKTEEGHAV